jgi:hypothetical protein
MEEIFGFHRGFLPARSLVQCFLAMAVSVRFESLHDKIAARLHFGKVDVMPIDA